MVSNTKLTADQKGELHEFKATMSKNMAFGQYGQVTVLVELCGRVVKVSTAVASPDEKKYRRKVGEYMAMQRHAYNIYAILPTPVSYTGQKLDAQDVAQLMAETFNNI